MKALAKIKGSERKKAQVERDQIFELGKELQNNWVEFYLAVLTFRDNVVEGHAKWELCGYHGFDEFIRDLAKRTDDSRSTIYAKLSAMSKLPKKLLRELGKTKSFQAARLSGAGMLNKTNLEKLRKMDTESAKEFVRKKVMEVTEGRRKISHTLPESTVDLYEEVWERFKRNTEETTVEAFWDWWLGQVSSLTDRQIIEEYQGQQEKEGESE